LTILSFLLSPQSSFLVKFPSLRRHSSF